VFSCFDWLDKSNGAKAKLESGAGGPAAEMMYTVFVQTGDCRGAGTDANVTINIHGTNTDSGEKALEGGGNDFERAQLDEFVLTSRPW
jgi:VCBS repeat-containing protein